MTWLSSNQFCLSVQISYAEAPFDYSFGKNVDHFIKNGDCMKPGNGDCLHDKMISQVTRELMNRGIS